MNAAMPDIPDRSGRGRMAILIAMLVLLGAGWGLTQPLNKVVVSGGYRHFGIVFWQLSLGALLLGLVMAARGRPLRRDPPRLLFYALIAVIGTVVPASSSYQAAVHLPAGILSIMLSLVPMLAFPIALAMGTDRFSVWRLAGLGLGLAGVAVLVLPEASLPDPAMAVFLPLALIAPLFYAIEGNVLARWGRMDLDPVELLCGASIIGAAMALPLAIAAGQMIDPRPPWSVSDAAVAFNASAHAFVYVGYVWLVGAAGAVFAAQVAYLVTGFGVLWSMLLLGERYSGWVWLALALMFAGLFLVQPRRSGRPATVTAP